MINKKAIRCITGLTISTKIKNLYAETGLLPLKQRRKFHRLVLMYKIVHDQTPNYLCNLLPQTAAERNPYPVRNENILTNILCKTEAFRNSYFPSTIRDWNYLPDELKNSPSVESFKFNLKKRDEFKCPLIPKWYSYGERRTNIVLARIRNNCSGLAKDLVTNHIQLNPTCANCDTNRAENACHYFIECPRYAHARQELSSTFQNLYVPCTVETILHGSLDHNLQTNKLLLDAVYQFTIQTKMFPSFSQESQLPTKKKKRLLSQNGRHQKMKVNR